MTPEAKKTGERETPISVTGMSFDQLKEMMSHMRKEGITHFRMGEGTNRISISRATPTVLGTNDAKERIAVPEAYPDESEAKDDLKSSDSPYSGHVVTSPVVGVFYDTPAPDQDPYVEVGSFVKKGDVLCIIEAMKLMNEVTSPISGTVCAILVQKASRVEFGQELFVIEPSDKEEENDD